MQNEERVGANYRAFQLTSDSVQAGPGGLCWSTALDWSPGACTAGVPVGLAPCGMSGSAALSFNKTSGRVQSGHCAGMCAAKAGGPPASQAIVLDKCSAADATGWTALLGSSAASSAAAAAAPPDSLSPSPARCSCGARAPRRRRCTALPPRITTRYEMQRGARRNDGVRPYITGHSWRRGSRRSASRSSRSSASPQRWAAPRVRWPARLRGCGAGGQNRFAGEQAHPPKQENLHLLPPGCFHRQVSGSHCQHSVLPPQTPRLGRLDSAVFRYYYA